MNKVTELKVGNKQKTPVYYIICEGNTNPVAQTYDLEKARMTRDQLEDLWIDWWTTHFGTKPMANRYSISVNQKGIIMPNEWMDEIVKILNLYYDDQISHTTALAKINLVSIDYKEDFEMFESQFKDK